MAAGAAALGGPFQGFVALAGAGPRRAPDFRALRTDIVDQRDNIVRLHVPEGFAYRSFHDTSKGDTLDGGATLPPSHDGMAAFAGPNGTVRLIRNHERNGPGTAFSSTAPVYDPRARGGTTTGPAGVRAALPTT